MKGYKVTDKNYKCRDMLIEAGKEYTIEGELKLFENGIHFCVKAEKCFDYYKLDSNNHIFEIDAIGDCIGDIKDKMCTNRIKIIREIPWNELMLMINNGIENNGISNIGNWNTGDSNIGNNNTGYWNKANNSNGIFCINEPKIKIFDIDSNMTLTEFKNTIYYRALFSVYLELNIWITFSEMTIKEKKNNKNSEKMGGYMKNIPYKIACKIWWEKLTNENKKIIKSMPNFDAKKFFEITGITIKD